MEEESQQTQVETDTKKKSSQKMLYTGVMLAAVVVILGYFLVTRQGGYPAPEPATTESSVTQEQLTQESGQREVREIMVEGNEFSFSPTSLSLTAGETVRLTFSNIGNSPHNFIVEGTDIATQIIPAGGTGMVEFDVPETGTYTFYCSVGNHRALGMEGTLEIE